MKLESWAESEVRDASASGVAAVEIVMIGSGAGIGRCFLTLAATARA